MRKASRGGSARLSKACNSIAVKRAHAQRPDLHASSGSLPIALGTLRRILSVLCLDNDLDALVRYDKVSAGGVGLSITRQIMQSHGGFVTVRSSPGGGGSVFTLRFQ
jgi:hypothetical protein